MAKNVKLGLIGAGHIAKQHLEVLEKVGGMEAVGITSRTKAKAQDLARQYRIGVCADDIDSLVNQAKPDALMVLVSENQVCSVVSSVIPLGLPLFIEKPAGLSSKENLKLANLAKEYAVSTMVGFNRRYYSIFHKGIKIIKDHGPLLGILVEGHERMWRVREGKKFSEDVLSNWIFANSTHTIDLLRFFAGEPKEIKSFARSYLESGGDQFAAIIQLDSGTIGHYLAHWYSPGGWKVVLFGDGVTVEYEPLEKGRWIDKSLESHEIVPDDVDLKYKPGFFRQMEAFGRLVRNGRPEWPILDLEGSYKTMLLAKEISANSSLHLQKAKIG